MKDEKEIRALMAQRGGNITRDNGQSGAVKIRQRAERSLLRTILELDDDQALCCECLEVEDEDENWPLRQYCPDCRDGVQTRLTDTVQA